MIFKESHPTKITLPASSSSNNFMQAMYLKINCRNDSVQKDSFKVKDVFETKPSIDERESAYNRCPELLLDDSDGDSGCSSTDGEDMATDIQYVYGDGASEGHTTKTMFPKTMPAFSPDNPIQAVYLKKKGVERLLAKNAGSTMGFEFAEQTKKKIEMESMLINRKGDDTQALFSGTVSETISTIDEIEESSRCPELSYYDSDEESDWSLTGVEKRATNIRYIYGDGDYYDAERRQRRNSLEQNEREASSESITIFDFVAKHLICNPEYNFTISDWIHRKSN